MHLSLAYIGKSASKQGGRSPRFPVVAQSRVQRAVRAFDLLKAESVKAVMGQERNHLAPRGVRRGHREFLSVHHREPAIGLGGCHLVAPSPHPFAKRSKVPVGEPTEDLRRMVGPKMVTEA